MIITILSKKAIFKTKDDEVFEFEGLQKEINAFRDEVDARCYTDIENEFEIDLYTLDEIVSMLAEKRFITVDSTVYYKP